MTDRRPRAESWHYCADAACRSLIPSYMLFCHTCWARVPAEVRKRVNRAGTSFMRRSNRGTVKEKRETLEALVAARKEALVVYEAAVGPVDTSGARRQAVTS